MNHFFYPTKVDGKVKFPAATVSNAFFVILEKVFKYFTVPCL